MVPVERGIRLKSVMRSLQLTFRGKYNGNQLIISGLIMLIRSGWMLNPTLPYR